MTFEFLHALALKQSDNECAKTMQEAKQNLFKPSPTINKYFSHFERRPLSFRAHPLTGKYHMDQDSGLTLESFCSSIFRPIKAMGWGAILNKLF